MLSEETKRLVGFGIEKQVNRTCEVFAVFRCCFSSVNSHQLCMLEENDLAVGTFLPVLNQLISLGCCHGVGVGGLGGISRYSGALEIWEWRSLRSGAFARVLKSKRHSHPLPVVKIKQHTVTQPLLSPTCCILLYFPSPERSTVHHIPHKSLHLMNSGTAQIYTSNSQACQKGKLKISFPCLNQTCVYILEDLTQVPVAHLPFLYKQDPPPPQVFRWQKPTRHYIIIISRTAEKPLKWYIPNLDTEIKMSQRLYTDLMSVCFMTNHHIVQENLLYFN